MTNDDFQPAFWAAYRALIAAREAAFARHGVGAGQSGVLARLWDTDGQAPGEIARALELSTSAVSSVVVKMEAEGLVARESPDSHHVVLRLTLRGRDLERIIEREMRTLTERAIGSLSDAERAQFTHALREMRANLARGA